MHGLETAVGGMTDVFTYFTGKNKTKKLRNRICYKSVMK